MQKGAVHISKSSTQIIVLSTFALAEISVPLAYELANGLNFGKDVLVGDKIWRSGVTVLKVAAKKVLTIQVSYRSSEPLTDVIVTTCKANAEQEVFIPIAGILEANDVPSNELPAGPAGGQGGQGGQQNR